MWSFTACTKEPYLGYGAGTDFERKIVVKVRAAELLRDELMRPSWRGQTIAFSFTSDPYLPLETHYQLTRRCLEVCLEFRNPVTIVTKSALVRRDRELIAQLTREARASVYFTVPFADLATSRAVEPHAPSPDSRFKAMEELAGAGIPVGIGIAPVIPGLNDAHIPGLLKRARDAGATDAFLTMLRLPGSVAPYFEQRLREKLPTKAERVLGRIRDARGGQLNSSEFGERMRGQGEYWRIIERSFRLHSARLGLNKEYLGESEPRPNTFRRPSPQGSLFG